MMVILCVVPSLALLVGGLLVAYVSHRTTVHAAGGVAAGAIGALGLEAVASAWVPLEWIVWPLIASAAAFAWLAFVPHTSPTLQRWSVTDRGALGD